ncbi:MAG: TonB-dependent receptor plug domain-containing protein, partial [Candidatus Eisenbacteria bacterium]|nr:TonB-dependent receptor plug domain-containing protein [Candidatus Eisenbacteria bacterium]
MKAIARALWGAALLALAGSAAVADEPSSADAPGRLVGRVVASDDAEALPYANIQAYRLVSAADSIGYRVAGVFAAPPDGRYELDLPPGLYRLHAGHVACRPAGRRGVRITAGRTETIDLALPRALLAAAPVTVTARRARDTEAAVLLQQRQAAAVSDAISAEQIRKTTDGSAAEALQRVSGVSTVGQRYIFVRGLGERYSATLINGSPVGSPEPNKKVVPLDLIPSALLDQIFIQKAYTPDQPGEFGGGTVNIRTRGIPDRRVWSLGVTSGADEGTTGASIQRYGGGRWDFLGFDDGTRGIPKPVLELAGDSPVKPRGVGSTGGFTSDEIESMGESFNKVWSGQARPAPPPYGVSVSFGNRWTPFGRPLGLLLGGVLKNSFSRTEHEENSYEPGEGGMLAPRTAYDVATSTAKTQLGLLGDLGWRPEEHTTLKLTSFYNRASEDEYRFYEGLNTDHGSIRRSTRLRFLAREIWSSQLAAQHALPLIPGGGLDWQVTYSRAAMDEPDRREYQYEWRERHNEDDEDEGEGSPQAPRGQWELSTRSLSQGLTRIFGELAEEERGAGFGLTLPLPRTGAGEGRLRLGYQQSFKSRDVAYRRFAFVPPTSGW